jgi:L-seryl-tRNA(Ser) seleniumtransferase
VGSSEDLRRQLPGVDTLLNHPHVSVHLDGFSQEIIVAIIRNILTEERHSITTGQSARNVNELANLVNERIYALGNAGPHRVINATGIILHTGLGRAPLSANSIKALLNAAGYCGLEFDLGSGERGDRQGHVEQLLCYLTGAESALVVNNNAAALYLTLNALAYKKEVIVSRGQLIEIGGSFRLPDIMLRSGVKLVEVGTTNRTRISDYQDNIHTKTALLLRAHPSNYRIIGFSESVEISELARLGKTHGIPVVDDIGNGLLWDWTSWGLPEEENVRTSLQSGANLVLVSGDKVLGGPQAGIILGDRNLVQKLKKNPLHRVLRPDKLTLAALGATLKEYLNAKKISNDIPVWAMLTESVESLQERAENLLGFCQKMLVKWQRLEIRASTSEAGSGTLPALSLPSIALCCLPESISALQWAKRLRMASKPVISTIKQDIVWFNLRTISPADEDSFLSTIEECAGK